MSLPNDPFSMSDGKVRTSITSSQITKHESKVFNDVQKHLLKYYKSAGVWYVSQTHMP